MAISKKDKVQLSVIGTIIVIVLMVLAYNYRDRILPKPDTGANIYAVTVSRPNNPVKISGEIFQRRDFRDLRVFGPGYEITVPDTAGDDYQRPSTEMEVKDFERSLISP